MGYQLETTALISKDNYNAFRIRCIMLILGNLQYKFLLKSHYYLIESQSILLKFIEFS